MGVLTYVVQVSSLLDQAAAGDEAAFDQLMSPLIEPGLRLAFTMLGDRAEAEDATQEAIVRAWRKLGQLREGAAVRPWFLAIVSNQCRNLRRTRWFRLRRVAEVFRSEPWPDTAGNLDLQRALGELPGRDRQALFLRYYLDLPIEEVAVALGVSSGAAKVRIHRACARLRPRLREEDLI